MEITAIINYECHHGSLSACTYVTDIMNIDIQSSMNHDNKHSSDLKKKFPNIFLAHKGFERRVGSTKIN
jgi:hypothetical protein